MTILVDRPRWLWRGERWSHLASDADSDELHRFALRLGLRRLSFQGDHYDLPQPLLEPALAQGATLVDSRDLVRRLRDGGLRRRRPMGWDRRVRWQHGEPDSLDHRLSAAGVPATIRADIGALAEIRATIVLRRPVEWGVGVTVRGAPDLARLDPGPRRWVVVDDGGHHVDWFVPRRTDEVGGDS